MKDISLWCCIEGNPNPLLIHTSSNTYISDLKVQIFQMNIQYFTQLGVDAPHLIITKVCYIIIFI